MQDLATPFRFHVSRASLGLVDAIIIGVVLQTDPQLTFRNDIKSSIFDSMQDDTPISVFTKRVREVNAKSNNPRFTNGWEIQAVIKDGNETAAYTEKLSKAIEFVNEHINHHILS
jgi:hypothetical protein